MILKTRKKLMKTTRIFQNARQPDCHENLPIHPKRSHLQESSLNYTSKKNCWSF